MFERSFTLSRQKYPRAYCPETDVHAGLRLSRGQLQTHPHDAVSREGRFRVLLLLGRQQVAGDSGFIPGQQYRRMELGQGKGKCCGNADDWQGVGDGHTRKTVRGTGPLEPRGALPALDC